MSNRKDPNPPHTRALLPDKPMTAPLAIVPFDMLRTCKHAQNMKTSKSHARSGVMIQIRNVPVAVHRILKARAAASGVTLSEYILAEMRRMAEKPTREEVLARIRSWPRIDPSRNVAEMIREERERR
jgi:hypothetical protein